MTSLCALAIAACGSVWLSNLPVPACVAMDAAIAAYTAWLLRREASRQPVELAWIGGDASWHVDTEGRAQSLRHVDASVRGGIAVLTLAEEAGRIRRYVWWPDTLDAGSRRALRLAAAAAASANETSRADA